MADEKKSKIYIKLKKKVQKGRDRKEMQQSKIGARVPDSEGNTYTEPNYMNNLKFSTRHDRRFAVSLIRRFQNFKKLCIEHPWT